jgi:Domain of unknown function (DUF4276)
MTLYIAPIVEGETEEGCICKLINRLWKHLTRTRDELHLVVLPPHIVNLSSFLKAGDPEFANSIESCSRKLRQKTKNSPGDHFLVLILIDADERCPADTGPKLTGQANQIRSDLDITIVIAKREFENWFKAAASSLKGVNGLPEDLEDPPDPEIGSGDTWLTRQLQKRNKKRKYKKSGDALAFVQKMDFDLCRRNSPSFDKLCRELENRIPPPEAGSEPSTPKEFDPSDSPSPESPRSSPSGRA